MVTELLLKIGNVVAGKLAVQWFAGKKADSRRGHDLSALIKQRYPLRRNERDVIEALAQIEDRVAHQIDIEVSHISKSLPANELQAAIDAAADALDAADLSDKSVFSADVDPRALYETIISEFDVSRAALSEKAEIVYKKVLERSCFALISLLRELPEFQAAASIESLARLRGLAADSRKILAKLEESSLDAPTGGSEDDKFRARYLTSLSKYCDHLEVIGLTTHNFEPRTTLSVAYLSLSVTADRKAAAEKMGARHKDFEWIDYRSGRDNEQDNLRVESALKDSTRVVIRGEAGAGKSTLLRWLAINASRKAFSGPLVSWNECVPFLVKLRDYSDKQFPHGDDLLNTPSSPVFGPHPVEWVHRQFMAGRALLLVDGVDELTKAKRESAKIWLRKILNTYPEIRVIVTSRPTAVGINWLNREDFTSVVLESMNPLDIKVFLRRWHDALMDAATSPEVLPCSKESIPEFQRTLFSQLQSRAHLRSLARNPLLCAMLCALNLDRRARLPRDRATLYSAALEMLLERRDADRNVASGESITLTATEKTVLLRALAWWLNENSRSQISYDQALARLEDRLKGMSHVKESPSDILDYLIERSGVIRKPVEDRVDFIHRTFQEFLAAQEAVDRDSIDLLIRNSKRDLWRETILMACAQGSEKQRGKLIDGILELAHQSPAKSRRQLLLLAAACKETAVLAPPAVMDRLDKNIELLVPPRSTRESRSLATVGESILRYFPEDPSNLTTSQAVATVRTVALVNGPDSIDLLSKYRLDGRHSVQHELLASWSYFDPETYARRVLADAPLFGENHYRFSPYSLTVDNISTIQFLPIISNLRQCRIDLWGEGKIDDQFAIIRRLDKLANLTLLADDAPEELAGIANMSSLRHLFLNFRTGWPEKLTELSSLSALQSLSLVRCVQLNDFSFLRSMVNLSHINLHTTEVSKWLRFVASGGEVKELRLTGVDDTSMLRRVLDKFPNLVSISLYNCKVEDLSLLRDTRVRTLDISGSPQVSLSDFVESKSLRHVQLSRIEKPVDMTPVSGSNIAILIGPGVEYDRTSVPREVFDPKRGHHSKNTSGV